ncbi:MAG: hypothetical protein JST22_07320 [Bacteroidetes bacterium]|nr:hypothetical protein [Bacteroidota bacterium]
MNTASRGPASMRVLPRIALAILLLLVPGSHALRAQPAPLRHLYGVGNNEFYIGAQVAVRPQDTAHIDSLWNFLQALGVNVLTYNGSGDYYPNIAKLYNSALRIADTTSPHWNRMVLTTDPLPQAGFSNGIQFYPFDSSQSSYFICRFTQRSGGSMAHNAFERNENGDSTIEQEYSSINTSPGQMVASGMAFDIQPAQRYLYRNEQIGGTWADHGADSTYTTDGWIKRQRKPAEHPALYIAVAGHLFYPTATNDLDSFLLRLEVWYTIPKDSILYTDTLHHIVATTNLEKPYATFYVRKRDFLRANNNVPEGKYQEAAFKVDLLRDINGMPGPLFAGNPSRSFDVRVYWTGHERLALRSVSLRDSVGQLLLGQQPACDDYRAQVIRSARRLLTGDTVPAAPFRNGVIMLSSGIELMPFEDECTGMINRMVRDSFNIQRAAPAIADTVGLYNFGGYTPTTMQRYEERINFPMVMTETLHDKPDGDSIKYEVPFSQLPSLRLHNGGDGRSRAQALGLTADSVEIYETTLQRMIVGRYGTGVGDYPYSQSWAATHGNGAELFRRSGRRLLSMIGTNCAIWSLRDPARGPGVHLLLDHIPEAAEIRVNTNLALCYGSRGIEWYWLGGTLKFLNAMDSVGWQDSFGSNGPLTSDTSQNVIDLVATDADAWGIPGYPPAGHYPGDSIRVTFPNVYVGWRDRTREVRRINAWLARIGPEMAKIRWRDGYSIHAQAPRPGTTDMIPGRRPSRTLPAGEIVTQVTSASLTTGAVDPPYATYVELGLFDIQPGRDAMGNPNPLYDTNHIFIVNRRAFERPDGIDLHGPDSADAQKMELLAESRRITLDLNLHHPNGEAYNFVRVREIVPDTTRLPLADEPRHGLDTILYGDSTLAITLRPGGAALLRITYCPPETALGPAELRRSSQKKLLYSGERYYATYVHQKTCFFPFGAPKKSQHPTTSDAVFLRRSYPMADTVGGIQWEPIEYTVSDTTNETRFLENRFPSLTLRNRNDSTIVSVVWTNYGGDSAAVGRRVNYRAVLSKGGTVLMAPIELAGIAHGQIDSTWGTPVASRLHGCDMVAWGDSLYGIMARGRRLGVWSAAGAWTPRADTVTPSIRGSGRYARYPSMPPFADIRANDSNVAIAWEQLSPFPTIWYARLLHQSAGGGDAITTRNTLRVSTESAMGINPSMDQLQDVWHRLLDGVTWEEIVPNHDKAGNYWWETWLNFRSLRTPATVVPGVPDSIGPTEPGWSTKRLAWLGNYSASMWNNQVFPNASALNQAIDTAHQFEAPYVTLVHRQLSINVRTRPPVISTFVGMANSQIQYGSLYFTATPQRQYIQNGYRPSGASADVRLPLRYSSIYQMPPAPDTLRYSSIHTSRQFYAKSGPDGYVAQGLEGAIHLSDTAFAAYRFQLHDVWMAGPALSAGVPMAPWAANLSAGNPYGVADLPALRSLMTTTMFRTHDSTTVGCYVSGRFDGDTARASGSSVTLVAELVDSASNTVLCTLDSFRLSPGTPTYANLIAKDLNLLSGSYYVRLRIDTAAMRLDAMTGFSQYGASGLQWDVDAAGMQKLRLVDGGASQLRLSAQPNLAVSHTEVFFSVSGGDPVTLSLFDAAGHEMRRLVDGAVMDDGRYALDVDTHGLPSGNYLIDLRAGSRHAVARMVVVR